MHAVKGLKRRLVHHHHGRWRHHPMRIRSREGRKEVGAGWGQAHANERRPSKRAKEAEF